MSRTETSKKTRMWQIFLMNARTLLKGVWCTEKGQIGVKSLKKCQKCLKFANFELLSWISFTKSSLIRFPINSIKSVFYVRLLISFLFNFILIFAKNIFLFFAKRTLFWKLTQKLPKWRLSPWCVLLFNALCGFFAHEQKAIFYIESPQESTGDENPNINVFNYL